MTYDPQNPYNRTRLSDLQTNTTVSFKQTRTGVADWNDGPYIKWKQGVYKSIQDQTHRNFKRNFSLGVPVFGNLLLNTTTRSADNITALTPPYSYGGKTCTYQAVGDLAGYYEKGGGGHLATLIGVSAADIAKMQDIALINAYAKMNASSLMGVEFLSELDSTVSMLRRPMKGAFELTMKMLTKSRRYFEKYPRKTAKNAARASANAWLEERYGWTPLLKDADEIIRNATRIAASPKKRLVARASQGLSYSPTAAFSDSQGGTTWLKASGSVTQTHSVSVHAGVLYDLINRTTSEELLAFFGLRLRDAPASLWELLPLSFVADWFVGVGSWLQAITPDPSVHVLGNWITVKEKKVTTSNVSGFKLLADGTWRNANGSGSSNTIIDQVKRSCDLPVASAPVTTVGSLSLLHSVDGLALLTGKIITNLDKLRH